MAELNDLIADAFVGVLRATSHGYPLGLPAANIRRFNEAKFQDDEVNLVELPGVVVRATRQQQLHTDVAVWMFHVELMLNMQADDTSRADWDATTTTMESILCIESLTTLLNQTAIGLLVRGIPQRTTGATMTVNRHWQRLWRVNLWASRTI